MLDMRSLILKEREVADVRRYARGDVLDGVLANFWVLRTTALWYGGYRNHHIILDSTALLISIALVAAFNGCVPVPVSACCHSMHQAASRRALALNECDAAVNKKSCMLAGGIGCQPGVPATALLRSHCFFLCTSMALGLRSVAWGCPAGLQENAPLRTNILCVAVHNRPVVARGIGCTPHTETA